MHLGDYIKASLPRRKPPPPRPISLACSPFGKLSSELVERVAQHLPPSAAAAFTITCRPIWFILGNRYLDRLWADGFKESRRRFLILLQRDLLYHIVCDDCCQLHRGGEKRCDNFLKSLCGRRGKQLR